MSPPKKVKKLLDFQPIMDRMGQLYLELVQAQGLMAHSAGGTLEFNRAQARTTAVKKEVLGLLSLLDEEYRIVLTWEEFARHGKKALAKLSPYGEAATVALLSNPDIKRQEEVPFSPLDATPRGGSFSSRVSLPRAEPETPATAPPSLRGRASGTAGSPSYVPPPPPKVEKVDEARCEGDFGYFCEAILQIPFRVPDADGRLSGAFKINTLQQELAVLLVTIFLIQRKPLRLIILKARQLGITTVLLAFWVWIAIYHSSFRLVFIIDKNEHNSTKMRMVREWLEVHIPSKLPHLVRFRKQDGNQIVYSNGSVFFFESAEASHPGTSESANAVHQSERTKWPMGRGQQIVNSLLPALPMVAFTASVNESTAQGMDDFQKDWKLANVPVAERTIYTPIPIFMPWFLSEEYQLPVPAGFQYSIDEKYFDTGADGIIRTEQEYGRLHKLKREQVFWRRTKIDEMGGVDSFDQEYPTTPEHAFRASGMSYFPQGLLVKRETEIQSAPPPLRGKIRTNLKWEEGTVPHYLEPFSPVFDADPMGELFLFKYPVLGARYVIGGDCAQGLQAVEGQKDKADSTIFSIKELITGRPVSFFLSRREPEELWIDLLLLALWYNMAYVNVELDGPGQTMLAFFFLTGFPNNLVWPEPRSRPVKQRMWTSLKGASQRRSHYLSMLRSVITQDPERLVWDMQVSQYRSFINHPRTGKPQAANGAHDDAIFADLHAEVLRAWLLGWIKAQSGVDRMEVKKIASPVIKTEDEEREYTTSDLVLPDGRSFDDIAH